ncbi:tol-pal system-associated acyl-CoA thioesterase [Rhodoferax sp. U11-2br]|uniref:tol-pal system-associated acyl-CoA thioesterase n=1 Tax=Rhodoferax sp. U11-2br TaxID=2838878 RepID=UPI001BE557B1|nr:tol-pal system-associated acyl-CoA thioesterase [Rhodoferax sp. U11-2br]MBT3068456.1 tol-pal system-associated acyl-CoA thioesterase [Rhodoferax sp. U11-2br]
MTAPQQPSATAPSPFTWPVRVYWEDTDAGGIVYYANYLKFFERGRTEWLRARGIHQQALREETGGMFVVSDAQVRYLKSARLDDELLLTTSLTEAGRASLTIHQQAWRQQPDSLVLLCEATIRASWVSVVGKPSRIPQVILDKLL